MKLSEIMRQAAQNAENDTVDPDQLAKGIEVEKEHAETVKYLKENPDTPLEKAFEMIARDHLAEINNYYDMLQDMESESKGEEE